MRSITPALAAAFVASTALLSPPGVADVATESTLDESTSRLRQTAKALKPWVKVGGAVSINEEADTLRVGNKLHVIWTQFDAGGVKSVRTRILNPAGAPASAARPVVTGWLALIADPKLIREGNQLRAVFSGIRSTAVGEQYVGYAFSSMSTNGTSWDLQPGALTQTQSFGNAMSIDAVVAANQPMVAMGGFGSHMIMHRGASPSMPAAGPDFFTSDVACCPATFVKLSADRRTGQVWAAWHPLGGDTPAEAGIFVQKVWPQPNGQLLHAPGSATAAGGAINPGQPVAMSERAGRDVWVAYRRGSPTSTTIRLWKVGTGTFWDVRSPASTVDKVSLAPGPGGRLWLSWRTVADGKLHAARTNPAVTRLGAIRTLNPPGGTGFIWNTAIEGSRGPLDVAANAQTGAGSPSIYAVHVLPGLTVSAKPSRLANGKVTIKVTDAGDGVGKAKVVFRGKSARTNAAGKAVFTVGPSVPDGRYAAVASKAGYAKASLRVRVT